MCFGLFELGLAHANLPVDASNLTLLLVQNVLKLEFELFLRISGLFQNSVFEVILFLFKFFDSLIQNINMQFQLLFYFDVVSYFSFILLELLFIFLWR